MGVKEMLAAHVETDVLSIKTPEEKQQHIEHLQSLLVMIRKARDILSEERENINTVRKNAADMDLTRDDRWVGLHEEKAEEGRENLLNEMKKFDGKADTLLLEIDAAAQKIRQEIDNCREMAVGDEYSEG